MWELLITLHSAAGIVAFGAGCIAVWRRRHFTLYVWSLIAMFTFLVAAFAIDWPSLNVPSRALFSALTALAAYMLWRAVQAGRLLPVQDTAARVRFIDHVGFTLIALFVGFVAIAALDLGSPGWLVGVVGVVSVAVGRATIDRVKVHASTTAGA